MAENLASSASFKEDDDEDVEVVPLGDLFPILVTPLLGGFEGKEGLSVTGGGTSE